MRFDRQRKTTPEAERGAVAVIVALGMIAIMLLLALVVDFGRVFAERADLQSAADAAALAGAQQFCGGSSPIQTAVDVGQENGRTIDPARVTVMPGADSYINVRVGEQLPLVFGGFAGIDSVALATQATATRNCVKRFQMVAELLIDYDGAQQRGGNLYAGKCFSSNGTGGYFDTVAVWTPAGNMINCTGDAIRPGGNSINERLYGQPLLTTFDAYSQTDISKSGYTKASMDSTIAAGPYNCSDFTKPIVCRGDVNLPDGIVTVTVLARGVVNGKNNTNFQGPVIYSQASGVAVKLKTGLAETTVVYAPNGQIEFDGSGNDVPGILIGQTIDFNGGGQNTAYGVDVTWPGPISLVQ